MTNYHAENFLSWLRDAHALEEQAEQLFSGLAKRFTDHPELGKLLQLEVDLSKQNQRLLSIRIQQLGGEVSAVKNIAGKLTGLAQNLAGTLMSDEPVKSILSLYTFTHLGIGSYKILITAAELFPDNDTSILCQTILNQYKTKALWLEKYLNTVTERFLSIPAT